MALTRSFKDTVKARVERDPEFRNALLTEAIEQLLAGEVDVGKAVLRDFINATIGFERLAAETGTPSKSLMRMLGPDGNPTASNLFGVISKLQQVSGIQLNVAVEMVSSA
jgi:DNA-binding phage protein